MCISKTQSLFGPSKLFITASALLGGAVYLFMFAEKIDNDRQSGKEYSKAYDCTDSSGNDYSSHCGIMAGDIVTENTCDEVIYLSGNTSSINKSCEGACSDACLNDATTSLSFAVILLIAAAVLYSVSYYATEGILGVATCERILSNCKNCLYPSHSARRDTQVNTIRQSLV